MFWPVNLVYEASGGVLLRYWVCGGAGVRERRVRCPAALLRGAPDGEAMVRPGVLETPEAVLFAAFRGMPLVPGPGWRLAEGGAFSPLYREVFGALQRFFLLPERERWCVRGEPGWFLQFGFREGDGSYVMGAFVLPCGKPAALTFRVADLVEALPLERPFGEVRVWSAADGLPAEDRAGLAWDVRVRLPIVERGAALVRVFPC